MKVLIQWATSTVSDWVQYDITNMSQVRALPRKPVPSDSPVIDDDLGWIAAVNIQGVVLTGDHVGFGIDGNGHLVVGQWNDDAADWAAVPFGLLYTFGPLTPDPALPLYSRPEPLAYLSQFPERVGYIDGVPHLINTQQTVARYADTAVLQSLIAGGDSWAQVWLDDAARRPWSEWPNFTSNNQLHGVWLDQPLWDLHSSYRAANPHGWREWS